MTSELAEILDEKGRRVHAIEAGASVYEAVERMVALNVGSLLVTDGGEIAGIVTERDYLRRVALEGRTDRETPVRDIMSSPLVVATLETTVEECMALMTDRRIRHVPVVAFQATSESSPTRRIPTGLGRRFAVSVGPDVPGLVGLVCGCELERGGVVDAAPSVDDPVGVPTAAGVTGGGRRAT